MCYFFTFSPQLSPSFPSCYYVFLFELDVCFLTFLLFPVLASASLLPCLLASSLASIPPTACTTLAFSLSLSISLVSLPSLSSSLLLSESFLALSLFSYLVNQQQSIPSVLGHFFILILHIICRFYTASETYVRIKTVNTLAINLLTSIDSS